MTRDEAIEYLKKIPEDEPVFVLRAQDKVAPPVIMTWAAMADLAGTSYEKTTGACHQAVEMARWRKENPDKVKVPD